MTDPKITVARPGQFRRATDRTRIPVAALKVGMNVIELDRPWTETPFIFQGFRIESVSQIEEIAAFCSEVVVEVTGDAWVPATERAQLSEPVRRRRASELQTPQRQHYATAGRVNDDAKALTRTLMDDLRLGRGIDVKQVKTTVSAAVKSILESPDAIMWLSRIRRRDEYTSEHCVNVGLLAINFGRHLGYVEEDLNRIGLAGMLHDVGKTMTPLDVLHKEGTLTQDEFEIMKAHTTEGRNILMAHRDVSPGAVDVAWGHHEAMDGSGYPRKVKSAAISQITRIVTLCDVYDAITSDRCYRRGQPSLRALDIMNRERGRKFDSTLVEEFVRCIGLYPTGSVVQLVNDATGIVISTNFRNRHLPRLLLVRDEGHVPCEEKILDLEKFVGQRDKEGFLIRSVVPNGTHGVRVEDYVRRGLHIQ